VLLSVEFGGAAGELAAISGATFAPLPPPKVVKPPGPPTAHPSSFHPFPPSSALRFTASNTPPPSRAATHFLPWACLGYRNARAMNSAQARDARMKGPGEKGMGWTTVLESCTEKMSAWIWGTAVNFTAWSARREVVQVMEVGSEGVGMTAVPALLQPLAAVSHHTHTGTVCTAGQAKEMVAPSMPTPHATVWALKAGPQFAVSR
jgi:hypothetical protein